MKRKRGIWTKISGALLVFAGIGAGLLGQPAYANPHAGQSVNVVIIGGSTLDLNNPCGAGLVATDANYMAFTGGGCLPVTGPAGELGDFTFTAMDPAAVNAAALAPFDTAVLNVASFAMGCNTNTLTPAQQTDLVNFVGVGKKLVIFDSECFPGPVDYSWMPFPFMTANPGALGAQGTLTVVEDNLLSTLIGDPSCVGPDIHCIDVASLGSSTDAVGDMNVMTTFDPNWCIDMSGTNAINTTGPVHTYAKYPAGTDVGLFIYNGLDQDPQYSGNSDLRKIWVQELQQPFDPSNLPCGVTVVGITLDPLNATNFVGEDHTVTATLADLLGTPQPGVLVTFDVFSGPNTGTAGTCSANADCTTDANGEVSFTYAGVGGPGTDQIEACFNDQAGNEACSQIAEKVWEIPPVTEGRITGGGKLKVDGMLITHGFRLECDVNEGPNSLQVNWGKGNKFHLTQLDLALCFDNPAIEPNPPFAGFDTYQGKGTGRYNGEDGATAVWTFTDEGEPGTMDKIKIAITDAGGGIVLNVPIDVLIKGNHQAH